MKNKCSLSILVIIFSQTRAAVDRSCVELGTPGWKCNSGTCIFPDWVCDGDIQCEYPDQSDEKEGCNLFPETGCKSWYGKRYIRCPSSRKCVLNASECDADIVIGACPRQDQWRCTNGKCIEMFEVCDEKNDCGDRSDEEKGCRLFPETGCTSWHGRKHDVCPSPNDTVCTLPEYVDDCRSCENILEWRCDNGKCISKDKRRNGVRDCKDGSDEGSYNLKWYWVLLFTMMVALFGILLSFLYRIINNRQSLFNCILCRSSKSTAVHRMQTIPDHACYDRDVDNIDSCGDSVKDQYEDCELPLELIDILDDTAAWKKKSLTGTQEIKGQHLYAIVHQNPQLYRNLYNYLIYRYASPKKLSMVSELLMRWEMEFHGSEAREALACWRLNLGSSETIKILVQSVRAPGALASLYERYLPVKDFFRTLRQRVPGGLKVFTEGVYTVFKIAYYSVAPFLGASALYFDIFKDMALTYIVFNSVCDLTEDNIFRDDVIFETSLAFALIIFIIITQICFVIISVWYSGMIFEMCEHNQGNHIKIYLFRAFSFVFAPFMPAFILANHVYYQEQMYSLQRDLQTLFHRPAEIKVRDGDKLFFFRQIEVAKYRSLLHRRIYSFYRVVEAVAEAVVVTAVLVLIVVVTSAKSRPIKLIEGVENKIMDFMDLGRGSMHDSFDTLNLVRDVVFGGSICYSFIIIATALTRYVYQCKNQNITLMGQACLFCYFACHTIARLTVVIAMFSTSEETDEKSPAIPLFSASVVAVIMFVVHFFAIFGFKWKCAGDFKHANIVEQCIHVLANTVAVIPFMQWDVVRPQSEGACSFSAMSRRTSCPDLNASSPRKRMISKKSRSLSSSYILPHDLKHFPDITFPLMLEIGKLNEEIEKLWWKNPTRELKLEDVQSQLPPALKNAGEDRIRRTFEYLRDNGFINKELFNPRRTKHEYFWLLFIHFAMNLIALTVEIVNGGMITQQGQYYSWDVRLGSFFFGLVFLGLYYKRYHVLHDLTSFQCCGWCKFIPIWCCCRKDRAMQAIPVDDEIQRCLSLNELNKGSSNASTNGSTPVSPKKTTTTIETQTSFVVTVHEDSDQGVCVVTDTAPDDPNENCKLATVLEELAKEENKDEKRTVADKAT